MLKIDRIDAHVHLVNFFQETEGLQGLLRHMETMGVSKAVLMGLPLSKLWSETRKTPPPHFLDDDAPLYHYSFTDQLVLQHLNALSPSDRAKFAPLICGFNPTDGHAIAHIKRVYDSAPDVWRGVGEILCRHDDVSRMTLGDPARPTHPSLTPVYEWCARKNLPILLHQNISSPDEKEHPYFLEEFEQTLRAFPKTTFVWAHCGVSPKSTCTRLLSLLMRMLDEFPNVFADLSWEVYEMHVAPGGVLDPAWVSFIEQHADRLCIGSDDGGFFDEEYDVLMSRYEPLLQAISPEARANISFGTAEKLYFSRTT